MQLQQFLTLTFCTAFEDKIEEEDPNLEAIEDFHTYFVNKIWGAMIFLDRVRQANLKYHGNENDFWEEQSPPVELAQFYNSAVNEVTSFT